MNTARLAALISLAALSSGCATRRIPGTDIVDNSDTRAILDVMNQYRAAVEARDAEGVINLVDPSFKEDLGTATPEDDLDYQALREKLPQSMSKLDRIKLDMSVRKIDISDTDNSARAIYTYTTSFRLPGLSAKPQGNSEIKEMLFKQVDRKWKIVSGI